MFKSLILFHRRLLVLCTVCLLVLFLLTLQLAKLTIVEGKGSLARAQGRLESRTYLPTWRGRIIDRKGRVIAEDVASYAVAIEWDVITGNRAVQYAQEDARMSIGANRWSSISPEERSDYIDTFLPDRLRELEEFWQVIAEYGSVDRGELERRLEVIRAEVEQTAEAVWVLQEETHRERYGDSVAFVRRPIKEQREPHVVFPRVTDETAISFEFLSAQLDGVIDVEHSRQRDYAHREQLVIVDRSTLPKPMRKYDAIDVELEHVAKLSVGDVRSDIWLEDIQKRPFRVGRSVDLAGYRAGDEVGKWGLELSLEDLLRGTRGEVVRHRNGKELSRTAVQGGEDVQVTLDISLQGRVEAVLSPELGLMTVQDWHRNNLLPTGAPLRGAVVVLDVESSEILAMASTPGLNRAANGLYPPGSIIKPLVLAIAMTDGKLHGGDSIDCVGHFFENVKDSARCWIYKPEYNFRTHGLLRPVEAIARSCNIFFYELGTRIGFEHLIEWLQRFGMSQPLSSLMTNPNASGTQGHVPSKEDIEKLRLRGAIAFETVSIAIGQGALTWSPLHAASAFATLVRGGVWVPPSLLMGLQHETKDLELHKEGVALALAGLHDSVSKPYGTGSQLRYGLNNDEPTFNVNNVRIWGKTGTAEAPPYKLHTDSKTIEIKGLDHSWFLVMASSFNEVKPSVVVAVLVEHGGSGGRVAGPIANQILHALQIEGYLEPKP